MNTSPLVSVVLPLYNSSKFILDSVNSILNQTYTNFELIIIDDCSTDDSYDIVNRINDNRIKLIKNQTNLGLNKTLNYGISLARGKYIARMDHDDISLPQRFEIQVNFLEKNNDYILIGCNCDTINNYGDIIRKADISSFDDAYLKSILFFACPFVHPSIMIRKSVLDNYSIAYNEEIKQAEDYVLYCSIAKYGKFYSTPEVLFHYREHDSINRGTSLANKTNIIKGRIVTWTIILNQFKLQSSDQVMQLHDKFCYYESEIIKADHNHLRDYLALLKLLKSSNNILRIYDRNMFNRNISKRVYSIFSFCLKNKIFALKSVLPHILHLNLKEIIKLLIEPIRI